MKVLDVLNIVGETLGWLFVTFLFVTLIVLLWGLDPVNGTITLPSFWFDLLEPITGSEYMEVSDNVSGTGLLCDGTDYAYEVLECPVELN